MKASHRLVLFFFLPLGLLFPVQSFGQQKSLKDIPPPIEITGPHRRTDVFPLANGDQILQANNTDRQNKPTDKPTPSRTRIFIPGNHKVLRAIIFDLGYTYTCDSTDLQAIAREEGWAIVSCLLRYKYGTDLLQRALADFAERTGHPELVNLPLFPMGFSRNGSRAWDMAEELPDRVAGLALGGNPGIPANFKNPARIELARHLPVLTVVGSRDPFVDYDKGPARFWHNTHYLTIRQQTDVTWGMQIGWGYGHGWEGSWTPFTVFFQETLRVRCAGGPKMKSIPFAAGWLAEYGWQSDWPEIAPVNEFKGDATKAIWLPTANVAHVWRAYQVEKPKVTLALTGAPSNLTLTATAPAATTAVEFYDRAQLLGIAKAAPFVLTTDQLLTGVRTVYAVAITPAGKTPSRPVTLAAGQALDWQVGLADQQRAELPENVARLTPEQRRNLLGALGVAGHKPEEAELTALRQALETLAKDPFIEQRSAAAKLLERLTAPR